MTRERRFQWLRRDGWRSIPNRGDLSARRGARLGHIVSAFAGLAGLGLGCLWAGAVPAKDVNQTYTNDEQTLCQPDVFRLCNDDVPDEDRIISCMRANHALLSPQCRRVFDVGIKKLQR